jgi:hypothetical protein
MPPTRNTPSLEAARLDFLPGFRTVVGQSLGGNAQPRSHLVRRSAERVNDSVLQTAIAGGTLLREHEVPTGCVDIAERSVEVLGETDAAECATAQHERKGFAIDTHNLSVRAAPAAR